MTDHVTPIVPKSNLAASWRRTCPECGETFVTTTHDRQFCTDPHRAAFHNRSSKVGRSIVPLAIAWREGRNVKGKSPEARARRASANRAFDELVRAIDAAARTDREAGRPPKLDYLRNRAAAEGNLYPEERAAFHEKADKAAAAAERKAARLAAAATV